MNWSNGSIALTVARRPWPAAYRGNPQPISVDFSIAGAPFSQLAERQVGTDEIDASRTRLNAGLRFFQRRRPRGRSRILLSILYARGLSTRDIKDLWSTLIFTLPADLQAPQPP
jgi:hypothetical protein